MKKLFQAILQRLLGFDTYLFVFSIFKIKTLRWDSQDKEGDFNYFCQMLKPEDWVLDIGANVGIMTAHFARQCNQGKVLAFEPVPHNVKTLRRVIKFLKLDNVEVFPIALGNQAGEVEIKMPVLKGVKMQGLSHVNHESIEAYNSPYLSFFVKQQALDELEAVASAPVAAIKMDVENYEQFILKGAKTLLRRHRPVLYIELWDNENRQECLDFLGHLGYRTCVLTEKKTRFV